MTRTFYVVVPLAEVTVGMISLSVNRKIENCRRNSDGTLCLLKAEYPIHSVFLGYQVYTLEEIHALMEGEEWQ